MSYNTRNTHSGGHAEITSCEITQCHVDLEGIQNTWLFSQTPPAPTPQQCSHAYPTRALAIEWKVLHSTLRQSLKMYLSALSWTDLQAIITQLSWSVTSVSLITGLTCCTHSSRCLGGNFSWQTAPEWSSYQCLKSSRNWWVNAQIMNESSKCLTETVSVTNLVRGSFVWLINVHVSTCESDNFYGFSCLHRVHHHSGLLWRHDDVIDLAIGITVGTVQRTVISLKLPHQVQILSPAGACLWVGIR